MDENKKEYNSGGEGVPKEFVGNNYEQIQRAEARKKREHNLKKSTLFLYI
jgi:hypothetical protein